MNRPGFSTSAESKRSLSAWRIWSAGRGLPHAPTLRTRGGGAYLLDSVKNRPYGAWHSRRWRNSSAASVAWFATVCGETPITLAASLSESP